MSNFVKKDIVEVVGSYVSLEYNGGGSSPYHVGLCPFHNDHKPSLCVFERTQRVVCWSCWSDGGDVLDFVMKIEDCGFRDALKIATDQIDPGLAAARHIGGLATTRAGREQAAVFSLLCRNLFERLDFDDALQVQSEADSLVSAGKSAEALNVLQMTPEVE